MIFCKGFNCSILNWRANRSKSFTGNSSMRLVGRRGCKEQGQKFPMEAFQLLSPNLTAPSSQSTRLLPLKDKGPQTDASGGLCVKRRLHFTNSRPRISLIRHLQMASTRGLPRQKRCHQRLQRHLPRRVLVRHGFPQVDQVLA